MSWLEVFEETYEREPRIWDTMPKDVKPFTRDELSKWREKQRVKDVLDVLMMRKTLRVMLNPDDMVDGPEWCNTDSDEDAVTALLCSGDGDYPQDAFISKRGHTALHAVCWPGFLGRSSVYNVNITRDAAFIGVINAGVDPTILDSEGRSALYYSDMHTVRLVLSLTRKLRPELCGPGAVSFWRDAFKRAKENQTGDMQ